MCQKLWFGSSVMKLLWVLLVVFVLGFSLLFSVRFLAFPDGLDEQSNERGLCWVWWVFWLGLVFVMGFFLCVCATGDFFSLNKATAFTSSL